MFRVKIVGAGSIGNHLSHAARSLGWRVDLCDIDPAALHRTRNDIYPARYGTWDDEIRLFEWKDAPTGAYDLICVGTPPDSHVAVAKSAIEEQPRAVLVEKPFCTPDLKGAQALFDLSGAMGVPVFTGYDHIVGKASLKFGDVVQGGALGTVETLDVEFREHWGGIFAAHPWLSGPADSYLGFWKRGGGASGEHSHALNLWQHFAHLLGAGRVLEVSAMMKFETDGTVDYDKLCVLHLRTESGLIGRVVQDVVTVPPRKWARAQGSRGFVEWHCGFQPGVDAVLHGNGIGEPKRFMVDKTRPSDFIQELQHIEESLRQNASASPIALSRGLDTMLVLAAAHKSAREQRSMLIDYSHGYTDEALMAR